MRRRNDLADWLETQILVNGLPAPVREYLFARALGRRWRGDLVWPAEWPPLLVEVDGGTWIYGRHQRPQGYAEDCCKLNTAVLLGYRVLRVTRQHIESGQALVWIREALRLEATTKEVVPCGRG